MEHISFTCTRWPSEWRCWWCCSYSSYHLIKSIFREPRLQMLLWTPVTHTNTYLDETCAHTINTQEREPFHSELQLGLAVWNHKGLHSHLPTAFLLSSIVFFCFTPVINVLEWVLLFRPFAGNVSSLVTQKRNNKCHIYSKTGKDTELENVSKEEAESSKKVVRSGSWWICNLLY